MRIQKTSSSENETHTVNQLSPSSIPNDLNKSEEENTSNTKDKNEDIEEIEPQKKQRNTKIIPLSFGLVALLIVIGFFVQDFNTDLSVKSAVYQKLEQDLVQITDAKSIRPFEIMKYEMTEEQYYTLSSYSTDREVGKVRLNGTLVDRSKLNISANPLEIPMTKVSWIGVIKLANRMSTERGLRPCYQNVDGGSEIQWDSKCNGWRLLSIAEWEYAARGSKTYRYAGSNDLDEVVGLKKTVFPSKR